MATIPTTKYAKSGDVHIAYQVVGEGAQNLVFVPGWVSHLEYAWEEPSLAPFLRRLASFSRLILLDRRGTGLSDRVSEFPTLEQRMDDVRAVMDAAGAEQAAVFGVSEGGPMSLMFAATYPERTAALVVVRNVRAHVARAGLSDWRAGRNAGKDSALHRTGLGHRLGERGSVCARNGARYGVSGNRGRGSNASR